MKIVQKIVDGEGAAGRLLDWLQAPLALIARWYVGAQFFRSGMLKVTSWDSTLSLFADEYHVPLLSPHTAAVLGTAGELFFPVLLFAGFSSRLGAVGLFAVNALAVISYGHVLFEEGFEAALAQHVLWGSILLYLLVHGAGALSVDAVLRRRPRASAQQPVPAT